MCGTSSSDPGQATWWRDGTRLARASPKSTARALVLVGRGLEHGHQLLLGEARAGQLDVLAVEEARVLDPDRSVAALGIPARPRLLDVEGVRHRRGVGGGRASTDPVDDVAR